MNSRELHSFLAMAQTSDETVQPVDFGVIVNPTVDLTYFDPRVLYSQCVHCIRTAQGDILSGGEAAAGGALGQPGVVDSVLLDIVLDILAKDPRAVLGFQISASLTVPEALDNICRKINNSGALANRLVLEIVGDTCLQTQPGIAKKLASARTTGCRLALVNTHLAVGYTGHYLPGVGRYLQTGVPWDILKVGQNGFYALAQTALGRDELSFFAASAYSKLMALIVEGIDTPGHLAVARHAGVQFGQGELFRRREAPRWFAGHDKKIQDVLAAGARATPGAPSSRHAGSWPQGNLDRRVSRGDHNS